MSLLHAIEGAQMVLIDGEHELVYAWFGGSGVNIYDADGREVDYFTIGTSSKLTPARVRTVIARVMSSHDH